MIHTTFDNSTKPFITPDLFYGKHEKVCDICVATFSGQVIEWALTHMKCEVIGVIMCCNGDHPIYLTEWKGKKIAFYLTLVTASGAGTCIEEARCLIGCSKFVLFGSCGALNAKRIEGKLIVPTQAYRDEGMSYHYIEAADYIEIEHWQQVADFMKKSDIPFVTGKTWTTDAIYRETAGKAERLKNDGCIAVEMECAGAQAVCTYHGLHLYSFLFASDELEAEGWKNELLGTGMEFNMQTKCFELALDFAAQL